MIRAVLLDVYETLIDAPASEPYRSPYSHLLVDSGLDGRGMREARRVFMTSPLPTMSEAARALEARAPEARVSPGAVRRAEEELAAHLRTFALVEGAEEALRALRGEGRALVLVSNLGTPYREPIRRLGVETLVDHAVYSCDVGCRKPEEEIFRRALERAGCEAREAVMVGDDPEADVEGARRAGLLALHLARGARAGDAAGGGVVTALCDLPGAIRRLERDGGQGAAGAG